MVKPNLLIKFVTIMQHGNHKFIKKEVTLVGKKLEKYYELEKRQILLHFLQI